MAQNNRNGEAELSWSPDLILDQRSALGWTQATLGERADISERTVTALEAGEPCGQKSVNAVNTALRNAFESDPALKSRYRDIRRFESQPALKFQSSDVLSAEGISHPQFPTVVAPFTGAFLDREEAYAAIAGLLEQMLDGKVRRRDVYLAALHGLSEMRAKVEKDKDPPRSPSFQRFDAAIGNCIKASGANRVYVRLMFCIADSARLRQIEKRIRAASDAEGFEVRVFCSWQAIPLLTPLIIGDDDAFLAVDEPGQYRIKAGLHLHGRDQVAVIEEYWDILWNDRRAIELRSPWGINEAGFSDLRRRVADVERPKGEKPEPL